MSYASSLYHTLLTASTVGLGDVPIVTDAGKVVVTIHILVSVGTLSAIFQDAASLHTERKKMEERLQLMMRKSDPLLLEELHTSYVEAA